MKPKVYVETSVVSYLASTPNRDVVVAANQQLGIERVCRLAGYEPPIICTPQELLAKE